MVNVPESERIKAATLEFLERFREAIENGEVYPVDVTLHETHPLNRRPEQPVELIWQPEIRFLVVNPHTAALLQSLGQLVPKTIYQE